MAGIDWCVAGHLRFEVGQPRALYHTACDNTRSPFSIPVLKLEGLAQLTRSATIPVRVTEVDVQNALNCQKTVFLADPLASNPASLWRYFSSLPNSSL